MKTSKKMKLKIEDLKRKGKKGIFSFIFSRTMILTLFLIFQALFMFITFEKFSSNFYLGGGTFIAIIMYLVILNSDQNASVKLMWVILIFILPIFGVLLYLYIHFDVGHRLVKKRLSNIYNQTKNLLTQDKKILESLKSSNLEMYNLSKYIKENSNSNVYSNTKYKYVSVGEDMFYEMLNDIKKAKKYIFLEYFIIKKGYMWSTILDELINKVKQGVEVRLIYDGTCSFFELPYSYPQKLNEVGIKTTIHAPIRPLLSTHYNNRDHRKILVIDGKVSYTGGINLSDEYINYVNRYGHWKDTGIRIEGNITNEFTRMFIEMWNTNSKTELLEYTNYLSEEVKYDENKDFSIAYSDSPFDDELLAENVYLDVINNSKKNLYIMTPYFIIDDDVNNALILAAKKGVDVRIILPYLTDQKIAQYISKTYYTKLINAGVKIYEYTKGFVHAKMMLSDNKTAIIGTINMDYRSLYHHFECAVYIYNNKVIEDMYVDFDKTFKQSQLIIEDTVFNENTLPKLVGYIGRLIAPLI